MIGGAAATTTDQSPGPVATVTALKTWSGGWKPWADHFSNHFIHQYVLTDYAKPPRRNCFRLAPPRTGVLSRALLLGCYDPLSFLCASQCPIGSFCDHL
jgi:hypothetical protein